MIELTPEARRRFDEYLQRTRAALRGTRAVEPEEVEQNVIEHVELALAGVPAPVGQEPLRTVLEQLGPPERWLPEEEQPFWRRALGRLMNGPEDWRLTYLSFAVTVLSLITLPIGGAVLWPIAFLLSRAYVALMHEKGEPIGARGWLVLPPIVAAFLIFIVMAFVPGTATPMVLISEHGLRDMGFETADRIERTQMFAGIVLLSTGGWWILMSGILAALLPAIRWLFAPVVNKVRRAHLLVFTILGAIFGGIGALLLWAF